MAGAKKRSSESVADEVVVVVDDDDDDDDGDDDEMEVTAVDEVSEQPSETKVKKEKKTKKKKKEVDEADAGTAAVSKKVSSVKPMERQKKRKTLDKERHSVAVENADVNVKPKEMDGKASVAKAPEVITPTSGLPEFHISVFKDLALVDATVRESAVEALVTELQAVQEAYDKLENKKMVGTGMQLEAEKDDGLVNCAPSVRYAIRRLIRGASSSREFARQGFALGLTLLLSKICIPVGPLLKLIFELLEVTSSMKGQEVKDSLLGRLFAYGALVRSGRLIAEFVSDKSTPYIKEFTSLLITLAAKKRYLQEPAVALILDLVEKLPDEALLDHVLQTPGLHEWFEGAVVVGNPDALLLALKLRERISVDSSVFGKLLPNPYSHEKLLASDHISSLVNSLKESTFCQPRVQSVWPLLVSIILPDSVSPDETATSGSSSVKKYTKNRKFSSSEDLAKRFQCFYEVIIEGSLLQSSHDRKHLAFDVLLLVFPRLPLSLVPCVLSYKLVQCLMDILSTQDSWLYKLGLHFLKELSDWAKDDDGRRVSVILALQKHSKMKFDSITRTKTVKELMAEITTESGCMMFIQNLTSMFIDYGDVSEEPSDHSQTTDDNSEIGSIEDKNSDDTVGTFEFLKIWVVESLPSILKHIKLDIEAKIRVQKEILKFLAVQGLFFASLGTEVTSFELQEKFNWPKAATSTSLCRMCVEQLQLLLANAQKAERPNPEPNALDQSDLGSYFMRYLSTLRNIPSVSLFRSLSSEDENALKRLQAMESRLSTEERKCGLGINANKLHALRFLLIQLVLQVLLHPGEFADSSCEFVLCCKKFIAAPDIMDTSEDELDGDEAPELMDVLLDTLLSLLPQSSTPLRSAIEQVFKCFCENVTEDGVIRMLQIIRKEALKPRRSHKAESDDDSDNIEDDFLEVKEANESYEDDESLETDESDGQTDDSKVALGNDADGQEHPEGSDDSDGGMGDEEMFKMDKHLVNIFRERKKQTGVNSTHAQLVFFKLRVLPLLEIYLHENPGKPQTLTVYTHLAQAFLDPQTVEGSPQLGQRILGILQKKILKVKDYPKGKGVELRTLESLLEKNLKLASRPFRKPKAASNPSDKKQSAALERHKMIVSLAQNSTFWIMSIITANNFPVPDLQKIFNIFEDVLSIYFDSKKSQLKSGFLKEIFRRRPWVGHHLFGFLLEKCGNAKSEFRKVEALDLVIDNLKSMAPSTDTSSAHIKKLVKNNLPKLCHLVKELATKFPQKQARQSQVRKFCTKVLKIVSAHNLNKSFLKELATDAPDVFESKLGECFLALKK